MWPLYALPDSLAHALDRQAPLQPHDAESGPSSGNDFLNPMRSAFSHDSRPDAKRFASDAGSLPSSLTHIHEFFLRPCRCHVVHAIRMVDSSLGAIRPGLARRMSTDRYSLFAGGSIPVLSQRRL